MTNEKRELIKQLKASTGKPSIKYKKSHSTKEEAKGQHPNKPNK
jgi:hypothetical protein